MGPYAAGVKTDVPLSPESDEVASPKVRGNGESEGERDEEGKRGEGRMKG